MTTLLTLIDDVSARPTGQPSNAHNKLAEIRAFFGARIPCDLDPTATPAIIDVISDAGYHLPLEVLPLLREDEPSLLSDPEDIAKLLPGYCAIVRRVPDASITRSELPTQHGASLQLFRHSKLAGVNKEVEAFQVLERNGRLHFEPVFPPRDHRPRENWPEKEIAEYLVDNVPVATRKPAQGIRICHFACHLVGEPEDEYLEMRRDGWRAEPAQYYISQLVGARGVVSGKCASVVFLSTCRSGVSDLRWLASAVDAFRGFNPGSLIATLADVPDLAAAEFSTEFYRSLTSGSSVGAALRHARVELLMSELKNPFGMLFTSYGGEDVHPLVRADSTSRFVPPEIRAVLETTQM